MITIILSVIVLLVFYTFQISFVYKLPFLSNAIFIPTIVGIIVGTLFGKIAHQYVIIKNSYEIKLSLDKEKVLNQILLKSKETKNLISFLDSTLKIIANVNFVRLENRAGVFVIQPDDKYRMISHINLDQEIINKCAIQGIKSGECLCGAAIQKREVIFTNTVDERHTYTYDEMHDHGHYNLPIIYDEKVLGALVVYVMKDHQYDEFEENFLKSVVDIIALVINSYENEQRIKDTNEIITNAKRLTGLAAWQLDLNTNAITLSDEVYKLFKLDPNSTKLTEPFLSQIIHPDDLYKVKNILRKTKAGEPFEYEIRYLDSSNNTIYTVNRCTPIKDDNDEVIRLAGIVLNITDIRESEKRRIENERFIESIATATPYALYLLDIKNNKILFTNSEFDKNVISPIKQGFEKRGLAAIEEYVHPDDLETFREKVTEVLDCKKEFYSFYGRIAYDGKNYTWINQRFKPFKIDENGKLSQVLLVTIDVNKQKLTEEKAKELNEQLVIQNKKLLKANNELDRFIYSASHDLRAPLASILGLINLYERDTQSDFKEEYIQNIKYSVHRLDEFIHEIIDFSKNVKTEIIAHKVNLASFIQDIYDQIKYIFPDKLTSFSIEDNVKREITTDKDRLSVVIRNVLSNAIKYSDIKKEDPIIKCIIEYTDPMISIRFEDNGIGIDKAHIVKVFDMFYRASSQSTGSGLGLFITKETVENLGGELSIDSKIGFGTTLTIKVPELTEKPTEQ